MSWNRKFYVCYIGKNKQLEKRYGVISIIPTTDPPIFRFLTKNQSLEQAAVLASEASHAPSQNVRPQPEMQTDELLPKV